MSEVTNKVEAIQRAQELQAMRDQRLIETIENVISEWSEAGGEGPIRLSLETTSERDSAKRVLQLYAEANWDVTVDPEYTKVLLT